MQNWPFNCPGRSSGPDLNYRGRSSGLAPSTPLVLSVIRVCTMLRCDIELMFKLSFISLVAIVEVPRHAAVTDTGSEVNNVLLIAIVGSVIAVLLLVLIVAIILWRLSSKPRVTEDNYDTQAHDNPSYSNLPTFLPGGGKKDEEDPYDTLPGAEGDVPDVLKTKKELPDDVVGGSPDPYTDMMDKDKQNLVVPAEVVMDVDNLKSLGVKYKK